MSVATTAKQLAVAIAHTSVHHQHVRGLCSNGWLARTYMPIWLMSHCGVSAVNEIVPASHERRLVG